MIKALYISQWEPTDSDLAKINLELKDCTEIIREIKLEEGTLLIINVATRKEKLEKLNSL